MRYCQTCEFYDLIGYGNQCACCAGMVPHSYRGRRSMRVYTLYDKKVREYGNLVLGGNDGAVLRALREAKGSDTTMGKYPEDFDLVCVGEFDPETGALDGFGAQLVTNVGSFFAEEE